MAVRIPKVDALATQLPRALLFHRDSVLSQPCFPTHQLRSRNRKGDMKLAVAVVWRLDRARTALFEYQQHLALPSLHCAAALSEIADDPKPENLFVKQS